MVKVNQDLVGLSRIRSGSSMVFALPVGIYACRGLHLLLYLYDPVDSDPPGREIVELHFPRGMQANPRRGGEAGSVRLGNLIAQCSVPELAPTWHGAGHGCEVNRTRGTAACDAQAENNVSACYTALAEERQETRYCRSAVEFSRLLW